MHGFIIYVSFLLGSSNFHGPALFFYLCFYFCWVILFPNLFLERIFLKDMFCRFLQNHLRCESKTRVFFFGTFFIRSVCFFRSCFQSDCLERPHLVCNQNSCSMLDMFYFLEMCKEEKTQNFQSRIFSSCFCFGPFAFSGFSCDLFGFRFGYFSFEVFVFLGRACRYSLELFVSLKLIEDYVFSLSFARRILSSRNDEKQNSYIVEPPQRMCWVP